MDWLKFISRDVQPQDGGGSSNDGAQNNDSNDNNGGSTATEESPSWVDVLPDEAKTDPNITKYKTPDEFYKGYKNTVELVGRKGVIIPKDDAPPEEQAKFLTALGRPEKPEGYKFEPIKDVAPELGWDNNSDAGLAKLFHERGLPQKTANVLRSDLVGMLNHAHKQQVERETVAMKNAETSLRQEWGDKFENNLAAANKLVMRAGGQQAMDAMGGEKGLGNNPHILKTFAKIASMLSEDQMKAFDQGGGSGGAQGGNETKEQALQKINEMNNADKKHPLWDENHPKHDEAVAERRRLYKIAHGEGVE